MQLNQIITIKTEHKNSFPIKEKYVYHERLFRRVLNILAFFFLARS